MVTIRTVPVEYRPGGAYGLCQVCGFKERLSSLRRNWQGLLVCDADYDPKPDLMNPPRVMAEGLPPRETSPEPLDTFVGLVRPEDL